MCSFLHLTIGTKLNLKTYYPATFSKMKSTALKRNKLLCVNYLVCTKEITDCPY